MFNIEQSITEWRQRMLRAGVKSPVPLNELEGHLRDHVARQMDSGFGAAQAFTNAVQELGHPNVLKNEFRKNERNIVKRIIIVSAGILVLLCGIAFILPACAWYQVHGAMPAEHLEFLLLGIVITAAGLSLSIYGFKKRKI